MTAIIAHRGSSVDAPENTLASFRLAWEQGADAIEMDLRMSQDSQVVVVHDEDLSRMGGLARRVRELTADKLGALDVSGSRVGRWPDARVPRLADVLSTVPRNKRVFLEIKEGTEMLPELGREVADSGLASAQVSLIGFDAKVMASAKKIMSACECGLIVKWPSVLGFERLMSAVLQQGLDALDLQAGWPLDEQRVKRAHEHGLKIYVWTVDDLTLAQRLQKMGVDGITTNVPLRLRRGLSL